METENLKVLKRGWLAMDGNGAVFFHDSKPTCRFTRVIEEDDDGNSRLIRQTVCWTNPDNYEFIGYEENLHFGLTDEKPMEAEMEVRLC